MINFDGVTKANIKKHYPNWSQISYHHSYRILEAEKNTRFIIRYNMTF